MEIFLKQKRSSGRLKFR